MEQTLAELQNPDPDARVRSIRRLRLIGGPQAVAAITGMLDDPDERVRGRAAIALSEMEAREVVPLLIERLESDASDQARASCAFALWQIGDARAWQPFMDALDDRSEDVVALACHGLGDLGDPRAMEPLMRLLDHPARGVRKAACSALTSMEVTDDRVAMAIEELALQPKWQLDRAYLTVMKERIFERREAAADEQVMPVDEDEARRRAFDRAMREVRDPDPAIRRRAVDRLRELEGPEATRALIGALDDPAAQVRSKAVFWLGEGAVTEAVPALIERLLHDESAHVRIMCAMCLRGPEDERVTEALIQALSDSDQRVLTGAISGLGHIGDRRAVPFLLPLLDHSERRVRYFGSKALLELKVADPRLVAALERLAQDPEAEEHDLQVDEDNRYYLETHKQFYQELGEPEPPRVLKMHELVEQARQLLAQAEP